MTPIDWTQPAEAIGEQIANEICYDFHFELTVYDSNKAALYTVERMLEVCPVTNAVWKNNIKDWKHTPNEKFIKLTEVKEYLKSKL